MKDKHRIEANRGCYWCFGTGIVQPEQGVTFGGHECTDCDSAKLIRDAKEKKYSSEEQAKTEQAATIARYETTVENCDGLRDKADEQAREIERLTREAKNDAIAYKAVIERQEELRAELSAMKAQSSGVALPECVRVWFEAKQAHVKSVDDYNARLEFVKQHMPFGTSVDPEYQIMEAANRKVRELVWPMYLGLKELLAAAPSAASQKEQGE